MTTRYSPPVRPAGLARRRRGPAAGLRAAGGPVADALESRRRVHRAGRDDSDARRRAAAHEDLHAEEPDGPAADHPAAHALRHRRRGRQRSTRYYKELADDGYIFVFQDIRGKFRSEGHVRDAAARARTRATRRAIDEGTDTYDTIEWLLKNVPNNNGRVGMLGVSYDGWTTVMARDRAAPGAEGRLAAGLAGRHVARRRLPPQRRLPSELRLRVRGDDGDRRRTCSSFAFDRYDTYRLVPRRSARSPTSTRSYLHGKIPTWNDFVAHPDYDAFWKRQTMVPHLRDVKVPTLNVAGWWDQEDFYGPVRIYEALEQHDTGGHELPGRRPVEPRRLERAPGDAARRHRLRQRHGARTSATRCRRRSSPTT